VAAAVDELTSKSNLKSSRSSNDSNWKGSNNSLAFDLELGDDQLTPKAKKTSVGSNSSAASNNSASTLQQEHNVRADEAIVLNGLRRVASE
jgi:hypothetical protein